MRKLLSLFISFIMLFNLTAEIFAAPALLNKKEQQNITNVLQESYQNSVQEKDSDKTQNTDICKNLTQDLKDYKTRYENSLNNLTKISQEYDKLDKLVPEVVKAIEHENDLTEQYNLGITHNQKKIEEYEQNLTLHKNKLEELGGEEAFEEEYNLYQTWLALKPQIEEDQKLQEEIIEENTKILEQLPKHPRKKIKENTKILEQLPKHPRKEIKEQVNQIKDTIAQAQQKLQDYQENYFSYQDKFSTFEKQLNYLENLENKIMITNDAVIYPLESISAEIDRNKIEKNFFLEEFSLQENLNENSDWADILKSIENIVNNKEADLKNAKSTFRTAEKNLANKEACIFQEKMNAELPKAIDNFCVAALVQKNQKNLDPKTEWSRTQTEYQACINPVWEQKTLNKYAQNITMEDIADYKYIEYLGKYSIQEGQNLSINKQIEIGQEMAQIVKDLVLLNIDAALTLHYNIMGDREQAKILAKEVEKEWLALGGAIEQQPMHGVNWIELKTNGKKDLIAKQKYYSYRHKVFLQVPVISKSYINQIHEYISVLMLQVAQDKSTKSLTISSSVQELNNILNSNTLNEDTINAKFAELHHNWTEKEKEDYANSIEKRPFDPIMFAFGFSHVIDRNRTLSREQRNAKTGIELNKSESLRNIITFNTHLQTIPQKDQLNINAWNELAKAAYTKRASVLLEIMVKESSVMRAEYSDRPSYYSNRIEASLHEESEDLGVDFLTSVLFTGFKAVFSTAGRAMIKAVIKASANSVRKGLKMFVKREALLANKNLTTKALNNVTKKDLTLINKLQFETPIKHARHTLGRELGAKNAMFSRIKNSATSRGSRIFNTQFSDAEYKSLSSKLKGFYNKKQETKIPHLNNYEREWTYTPTKRPVKKTSIPAPTPKRPKARPEFADNIQRFIAFGKSIFKSENKKVTENAVEQATKQDVRGTTTKVTEETATQDSTKVKVSPEDTWITDTPPSNIERYETYTIHMGYKPLDKSIHEPRTMAGLHGEVGSIDRRIQKMIGNPEGKPVKPAAKSEYIAAKADVNDIEIVIETPYGERIPITLSHKDLTILSRGDTLEVGDITLGKDTLHFLEDVAKFDPDIAKHLQSTKKPGLFERIFGKKTKANIPDKVNSPAQAYQNTYTGGAVELNENELVRFVGNEGRSVHPDYIQGSKDARKYMIDAVESERYTASTESYMETMNEMHRVSASGKNGNLDWYKDAGQGSMSVNPGEIRTGGRPRNSRLEQAQKVEEIAIEYGDPFRVKNKYAFVDLPGIPTENLPVNSYINEQFFHYYPKGGEALHPYYQQMHRTAKEALSLINQQASEKEILEKLAEHYQYAANARPYGQINNSLFMNEVNTLLQKAGLRPMPHGELDIAAMHLQPKTFKKYFVDTYYRTKL